MFYCNSFIEIQSTRHTIHPLKVHIQSGATITTVYLTAPNTPHPLEGTSCFPSPLATTDLPPVSTALPILDINGNGILHSLAFLVWLSSGFVHDAACVSTQLPFIVEG